MTVEVKSDGSSFEAGIPRKLFEAPLTKAVRRNRYVPNGDGQRFLLLVQPQAAASAYQILVNWPAVLER